MKGENMKKETVSISTGNSKLGKKLKIGNVSLTPILSCPNGVPCASTKKCYALKSYRQYPNVRNAWDKNLRIYLNNPDVYFEQINSYLQSQLSLYFRWHVGGDIPSIDYLNRMVKLAIQNPQIQFLTFTKNYGAIVHYHNRKDYDNRNLLPKNLAIMVSAWPKLSLPKYIKDLGYRVAWYDDGTENRIPKKSLMCSGHCEDCLECWKSNKSDVILPAH
jgi:hypothetical protein